MQKTVLDPKAMSILREVGTPVGLSSGSLLWFRLLHRGLLGALLCAAAPLANPFGVSLAHERPRRLVIGHVLFRGHARNGAADHVESQVLQRFEADATFTHVELLAALLVFAGEPGGESGMTVEAQEMQHHARPLRSERNKWQRHFGIL